MITKGKANSQCTTHCSACYMLLCCVSTYLCG